MDKYGNVSVKQRCDNFDAAHGASIFDGAWIYFEDGARREADPLGVFIEPSDDSNERQKAVVYYYDLLLQQQVAAFDRQKKTFTQDPGMFPDRDKNVAELKALQVAARRTRNRLTKAQEALRRLQPGYRTPEEEAETIRRNEAIAASEAAYLAEIDAIVV